MRKIIIGLIFSISLLSFDNFQSKVYICNGVKSKVYHKSNTCNGLNRCAAKVSPVSERQAIKMGRRKCRIEYK
jgi:hypothetical protein